MNKFNEKQGRYVGLLIDMHLHLKFEIIWTISQLKKCIYLVTGAILNAGWGCWAQCWKGTTQPILALFDSVF
jgi:hypothetical protein